MEDRRGSTFHVKRGGHVPRRSPFDLRLRVSLKSGAAMATNPRDAYDRWATQYDADANDTRDLNARVLRKQFLSGRTMPSSNSGAAPDSTPTGSPRRRVTSWRRTCRRRCSRGPRSASIPSSSLNARRHGAVAVRSGSLRRGRGHAGAGARGGPRPGLPGGATCAPRRGHVLPRGAASDPAVCRHTGTL
jgi:hypothetical protein